MKFNIQDYYIPLIESGVLLFVLFVLRQILKKGVRNFTHKVERLEHRTALIIKHVNITIFALVILGLIFIWGVDFRNIGLVFSSVFAVIGIALFAQWSILSNITSGIIMFFTFPYRIGDYVRVHDKDVPCEGIIEDIKTFHIIILTPDDEIVTYPNSMMLQKGVSIIKHKKPIADSSTNELIENQTSAPESIEDKKE